MNMLQGIEFFKNFSKSQFCFYRTTLNEHEQKAYDRIRSGFLSCSEKIHIFFVSKNRLQDIVDKIKIDNPWLFYIETVGYQYSPLSNCGTVIVKYRFNIETVNSTLIALANKCSSILSTLKLNTDYEAEIKIHDFFCKNIIYDNNFSASSYECVGPLLFGKGVCEGISKAAKLLCDFANIQCLLIRGKSLQLEQNTNSNRLHSWNIIKISGVFYHLDITFDLTIQAFHVLRYDYFNLSDSEIELDHETISVDIPPCTMSKGYYRDNRMYMCSSFECQNYIRQKIVAGEKDIVFQIPQSVGFEKVKSEIIRIMSELQYARICSMKRYRIVYNEKQSVFHVHIE